MEAQAPSAEPFPVPGLTPPTKRTGVMRRIGDVIVQLGFAERERVDRVVLDGRQNGSPLGQALIDAGIVDSAQLAQALAERNGLDYVDLNVFDVDKGATSMIDGAKARQYRTIPIAFLAEQHAPGGHGGSRPTCWRSTTSPWPRVTRCAARSPPLTTSTP